MKTNQQTETNEVKSAVQSLNPTRVKLEVEVPYAEFEPAVTNAIKTISQQIQIPGFRKGKVPTTLIVQRVGRPAIMQEAVNDALPQFYQQAATETEIRPIGQPSVDVTAIPGLTEGDESDLAFTVEVTVRPAIELPDFTTVQVEIEDPAVDDDAVDVRLEELRERFGTLKGVDRPAEDGDFVSLDLDAKIGDEDIDQVSGVSYQIGEGNMLEGLDEALTGLSAGETTTFNAPLAGGDHAGEAAEVTVTPQSVKVRELPELDDDFAQLASEFDTLDELKEDLKAQAEKHAESNRAILARQALLDQLLEDIEIPVPDDILEEEIKNHLQAEGKDEDDPHGEEIRPDTVNAIKTQFLLDTLSETHEVQVTQEDLMNYMIQASQQYGMDPNTFIQTLDQSGQIPMMVGEVTRSKSLEAVLPLITVVDGEGNEVDLGLEVPEGTVKSPAPRPEKTDAPAESAEATEDADASEDSDDVLEEPIAETAELPEDLSSLSKAELQELAGARGLAKSGTKADIIERLNAE